MPEDDIYLPDWLQVDSLLPSVTEWKQQSNVRWARRARSSVTSVDTALEAFWTALAACQQTTALEPARAAIRAGHAQELEVRSVALEQQVATRPVQAVMDALAELSSVTETYVTEHLGVDSFTLTTAVGQQGPPGAHLVAANRVRQLLAGVKERVPPVLGLRWLCRLEQRRLTGWFRGRPPKADISEAWGAFTSLPTLDMWRYESSGGPDKGWTLRSRSRITRVDEALARWWEAFRTLQREESDALLGGLIDATRAYLAHKDLPKSTERAQKKARVSAAKRLLFRAEQERDRLQEWQLLLPPRVPGLSFDANREVDPTQGDFFMELRTTLPTPALWRERSSVRGKIRAHSMITLVDRALDRFWVAFMRKERRLSLLYACQLGGMAEYYLMWKDGQGGRVAAVEELRDLAQQEFQRLQAQWPRVGGELPPIVNDNDSHELTEVQEASRVELGELAREVDESAMRPLDGDSVKAFVNASIEATAEAHDANMAQALGDKTSTWFGRSRAYAQVLHPPPEASSDIFHTYALHKKWTIRQLTAIQSTSVVNYMAGVSGAIAKRGLAADAQRELQQKHQDLFVRVISVADHVARTMLHDRGTSAWKVLEGLGWVDRAPALMTPMISICTIVFACKWKDSKSALICGAVAAYGVKRAVVTGLGLGLTLTTLSEGIYRIVEKHNYIAAADIGGNAAAGGLSVFSAAGAVVGLPANAFTIYKSVSTHRALTTMLERYAVLGELQPAVVAHIDASPFFYRLRMALAGKLGRRQTRARIEGVAATASIASTVVGAYATIAVANAWNPVGWALGGLAALGSVGLLIYKIKHKSTQKEKLVELRRKYRIPPFVTTAGEWDRYQIADLVFRAALNDGSLGVQLLAIGYALLYLLFGGSLQEARSTAIAMGHVGIMAYVKG